MQTTSLLTLMVTTFLGFDVNADGSSASVALSTASPIQIPTASGAPQQTSQVDIRMNLPAGDAINPFAFDPTDPLTYNHSTSVTVFDSLGESHVQTYYFRKAAANEWDMYTAVDGTLVNIQDTGTGTGTVAGSAYVPGTAKLIFSSGGDFEGQYPDVIETDPLTAGILVNGADPTQTLITDFNIDTNRP